MLVSRVHPAFTSIAWLGLVLLCCGCEPIEDLSPQGSTTPTESPAESTDNSEQAASQDDQDEVYFDLGGEIDIRITLDPPQPTSDKPTHVTAIYASAYGRPKVDLEMRVVPEGGEPTDWQALKMTGGHVYDVDADKVVPVKNLDQNAPNLEYGDSVYETDFQFPAGKVNIDFREKDGESLMLDWPIEVK